MGEQYQFFVGAVFNQYYEQLVQADPDIKRHLDNQIRIVLQDPLSGSQMQHCPKPLQGMIRKRRVRRGSYRLGYIVCTKRKFVIFVYITAERRRDFDYRNFPWEVFTDAYEDFQQGKLERFRII